MKFIYHFARWGTLYLLVVVMIAVCFWENSLPILPIDQTLLLIGTLLVFGIFLNAWIKHNETNFLVSQNFLKQTEKRSREIDPVPEEEDRSEKIK
jgi:hypothetical protein